MGDVLVFFCVYNVCGPNVCVCPEGGWSLCVWAQSVSAPAGTGDSYLRSSLGVLGLCNGMCWGRLFLGVSRISGLFFGCLDGEGIGLILPCIRCFGVFLWALSIFYRNLNLEFRSGVFSQFKKSNFIEGPHTSLPYKTIGSIIDLKSLSQIWIGMSILFNLLWHRRPFEFIPAKVKLPVWSYFQAEVSVCFVVSMVLCDSVNVCVGPWGLEAFLEHHYLL